MDILVDQKSGMLHIVDLNHFPGYKQISQEDIQTAMDNLISTQLAIHRGEMTEDDEDDDEEGRSRYLKYALVGMAGLAVAAAAVYKAARKS